MKVKKISACAHISRRHTCSFFVSCFPPPTYLVVWLGPSSAAIEVIAFPIVAPPSPAASSSLLTRCCSAWPSGPTCSQQSVCSDSPFITLPH